ncbi:hypothetical protein MLD38_028032 [Melastoma candidum]|uniref:Uncharacterized protein n=1 Tax=Melastoma candidum TaxID=119954 RepID=A0ACB9N417_9MYRT|nr:hypothetical protein MLD38_028032 [Melastoma candidum]
MPQDFIFSLVSFLGIVISGLAYDPLDPDGNITIKWDILNWTSDGYEGTVSVINHQKYRQVGHPGWTLSWTWSGKEVIRSIWGAQATDQGDCSGFRMATIPHCCRRDPAVVDLLPTMKIDQGVPNCCRGGLIASRLQDPEDAVSMFRVRVGMAGRSGRTVRLPRNFTLLAPGPGYTCGTAQKVRPTRFLTPDGRRATQALVTWNVICTYSQFLARKAPACCVSLSAFFSRSIVGCPACSCGCRGDAMDRGSCVEGDLESATPRPTSGDSKPPLLRCTDHMCPIRVHWHVKHNYQKYWRAKITITNFDYLSNYSQWSLVVQHPNFENLEQIFSFNSRPISPYASFNDSALLWGVKNYNDLLIQAGLLGNVQSELLFHKNTSSFTLEKGWAFPRRVYFNGDDCIMPPPNAYPMLPNKGLR